MAGLLADIRTFHNAFRRELAELQALTPTLSSNSVVEIGSLFERLAIFRSMLANHEGAEDRILFPALDARMPQIVDAYTMDHRSLDDLFDDLEASVQALQDASNVEAPDGASNRLTRATAALSATLQSHLRKEEEHLLVIAEDLFSADEQRLLIDRMAAGTSVAAFMRSARWQFARLGAEDRAGILRAWQAAMPIALFRAFIAPLKSQTLESDWAELVRELPWLASV